MKFKHIWELDSNSYMCIYKFSSATTPQDHRLLRGIIQMLMRRFNNESINGTVMNQFHPPSSPPTSPNTWRPLLGHQILTDSEILPGTLIALPEIIIHTVTQQICVWASHVHHLALQKWRNSVTYHLCRTRGDLSDWLHFSSPIC